MLVVAGPSTAPASAQTTICSGVSVKDVMKCDPGWAANMPFMHWRMYGGHNCTNYVAYRLGRDGVAEPPYLLGNANTWASRAKAHGVRVDSTPEVGAVGAWPGRNHIVYVEEVGPGYLITSEDNFPGYYPKGMYRKIKVLKGERAYPTQYIHFKGKSTINGPLPTVSGTPTVGSTLTATAGTWSPSGVTLSYQWLRDGFIISGATSRSYMLTPSDVGHTMTISVTGSKSGLASRTASSEPTDPVDGGSVTSDEPTISGTPQVGGTLTAHPGTWQPSTVTFRYQWLADGTAVKGATGTTFSPTKTQLAKRISVRVTGSATGHGTETVESARTAAVATKAITPGTPTIEGADQMMVGDTLTATAGDWAPSGVALTYQWFRGGNAVTGATKTTYSLSKADLGSTLVVKVTGKKSGYASATAASEPTATAVPRAIHATTSPSISGEVRTGQWLTADPGTWGPDGVDLSYQWFRGDQAVTSGTTTRYKVTNADLGKQLTFTVTARKKSFTTVEASSEPTEKAKASPTLKTSVSTTKGNAVVTVIVTASGVSTPTGSASVSEGGKTLKSLDLAIGRPGRATIRLKLAKGTHTLLVSYSGSATVAAGEATVTAKVP